MAGKYTNGELGSALEDVLRKDIYQDESLQLWSRTKSKTPAKNMYGHWIDHKSQFPNINSAADYVKKSRIFIDEARPSMKIGTRIDDISGDLEKVAIDLNTGEFAVKKIGGAQIGAMKRFFIREGSPAERLAYFKNQVTNVTQ